MNPSNNNAASLNIVFGAIAVFVAGLCIYLVGSGANEYEKTGLLDVKSTNPKAALTITQGNSEAKIIGVGKAKVRLKPGKYEVSASAKGNLSTQPVEISKK